MSPHEVQSIADALMAPFWLACAAGTGIGGLMGWLAHSVYLRWAFE